MYIVDFFYDFFFALFCFTCTSQTKEELKSVSGVKKAGKLWKECGNGTQDAGVGWLPLAESGNQTRS